VRFNFMDIDRLISSTAAYTVLLVTLVGAMLTLAPWLTGLLGTAMGADSQVGQLTLSLLLAAGLVPAERHLRPWIERLFFPERHRLQQGVERLLGTLAGCATPQEVLAAAGQSLDEMLHPDVCRVYRATSEGFLLAFAREPRRLPPRNGGSAHPAASAGPARPSEPATPPPPAPLVEALGGAARAIALGPDRRDERSLPAWVYSALEGLGFAVVLPVLRGAHAAALVCLGPKRSGDVYTSTDLALLTAVAEKLSAALARFDQAELLRHERTLKEALLRYVPDPVAALLASGRDLPGGQKNVSILFADLRSFTAYSERHDIGNVLGIVNRYTEVVSGLIRRHGGTVVEFLGDGMMAIFGAPEPMDNHARAAVRCAGDIVAAVSELDLGRGEDGRPIGVSVGITTGEAFVGNVRAADRLIYTAIGDTANLASRLEGLTRRLDASVAIDSATHQAAGEAASSFRRHGPTLVRGRQQTVDVYFMPLQAA
jgi:class 3 adenylate cyclase